MKIRQQIMEICERLPEKLKLDDRIWYLVFPN